VREWGSPFPKPASWSTHRGSARRTGADGGRGPTRPKVLWVHKSPDHFIAPLVPGAKELFASSLGAFNIPAFAHWPLSPRGTSRSTGRRALLSFANPSPGRRRSFAGQRNCWSSVMDFILTRDRRSFACGPQTDSPSGNSPSRVISFTSRERRPLLTASFMQGGNAGVLCLEPGRVTFEGQELELSDVESALEQRWKEALAKYKEGSGFHLGP